jgi:hypothetical protein
MDVKNKRLKVLTLFLFTNICSYMLATSKETVNQPLSQVTIERPDYIKLKVKAQLKTNYRLDTPLVLTTPERDIYIPYVFIVEFNTDKSHFSDLTQESTHQEYLINVHKKHLKLILKNNFFHILPQLPKEVVMNNYQRRSNNYEITL